MQDRVPLYPGRVVLTPVSGQANTYDMTRADQPTQEGTPLNKASLLTDATAALFGLETDAVPDDVLAKISEIIGGLETGIATRPQIVTGTYEGDGSDERTITLGFQPKALLLFDEGGLAGADRGSYYVYGGLVLPGHPLLDRENGSSAAVELISTGFRLHAQSGYSRINENGSEYFYLALR